MRGPLTCPKKQFVSVEAWNHKKHGEFDQSKVVIQNIMGQDVRGCWIAKGQKGVYDKSTKTQLCRKRHP